MSEGSKSRRIQAREGQGTQGVHTDASAHPPTDAFTDGKSGNSQVTPRSKMKTLNLDVPDYLSTDLKIRAAHNQTSVRHVVMIALIKDGFVIKDADMIEDGRRLRGANKLHLGPEGRGTHG